MPDVAVVGPYDMGICEEAQAALALAERPELEHRALMMADYGSTSCRQCGHWMMTEGEVMMCGQCGCLTHAPTRAKVTWDQVRLINHHPQRARRPEPPLETRVSALRRVASEMDRVIDRVVQSDVPARVSLAMELDLQLAMAEEVGLGS